MNKTTRLIITRFLAQITQTGTMRSMLIVCCISITIGTFSLALVAAIMQGFETETHKKLQGIHTDLLMQHPHGKYIAAEAIQTILSKDFDSYIQAATPYAHAHVLIQNPKNQILTVAQLYGIVPKTEEQTSSLATSLRTTNKKLEELLSSPMNIIMGTSCAAQLGLQPHAPCNLTFMVTNENKKQSVQFDQEEVSICDTFKTGIDEFDARTIFCSLETFEELFPDIGIQYIGIKKKKNISDAVLIQKLTDRFHLDVFSWQALYPSLVSALALEKYAMFAILALITLVASMNIIALLAMFITHKKKAIAILLSFGTPYTHIAQIFVYIGVGITTGASILGTVLATITSYVLDTYHLIPLPDAYYTSYLPAHMNRVIIASVILLSVLLGLIASIIATQTIKHINISHELKHRA